MRSVGHVPRCSWEIPYDFTPRIRHYPGVKHGRVREAWMSASPDASSPRRTRSRTPPTARTPLADTAPHKPLHAHPPPPSERSKQPRYRRPRPPTAVVGPAAAARDTHTSPPSPPPQQQQRQQQRRPDSAAPPSPPPPATRSPAGRQYTTADLAALQQRRQAPTSATAAPPPTHPTVHARSRRTVRHRYGPRTHPAYTLPPSLAEWRRWLHTHRSLHVCFRGSHASRHGPPPLRMAVLPAQHTQSLTTHTTDRLEAALAAVELSWPRAGQRAEVGEGVAGTDTHRRPADTVHLEQDFNTNFLDAGIAAQAQRRAEVEARVKAVHRRLIHDVVPITAVLGGGGAAPLTGPALLDSGHMDDPIMLTDLGSSAGVPLPCATGSLSGREGSMAVLVQPIAAELAMSAEVAAGSAGEGVGAPRRPALLPRGREWDRQRAIRAAVGPTAQEAIIDLEMDPRYRQPGQYVRWRHGGGTRRAVK